MRFIKALYFSTILGQAHYQWVFLKHLQPQCCRGTAAEEEGIRGNPVPQGDGSII